MTKVYLGLGANLNQPIAQLENATRALAAHPDLTVVASSKLYGSKPMGPQDQPDYVNSVVLIETSLAPEALLDITQAIELEFGRVRKEERWGPRTLDIDVLLFGNELLNSERLTVPHYGMKTREFVLYPLNEISPDLVLPCGTHLSQLLVAVPLNGLTPLTDAPV